MKVAVIGSGLAGLTAAATLAVKEHQVEVFEHYHQPGGVTASYERDGFRWDLGQLLVEGFGPGEPVGKVLAALGVADRIRLRVEDRRYIFPDFSLDKPETYEGPRWRIERLKQLFPEDAAGLERYWKDYLRFTRLMTLGRQLEDARGLGKLAGQASLYATMLPFLPKMSWSAQRLMDSYFTSDKLKTVFMSILADFFTPPSQFMGLGVFALNPEASFDARMPAELAPGTLQLYHYSLLGGMGSLTATLVGRIQELGGKVYTSRPVAKINIENGRVVGVTDHDGNFTRADVVIASGGAKEVFFRLVGEEHLSSSFARRVLDLPLMDSVFMVHLGLDYDPSPFTGGPVAYYYGSYDLEGEINRARAGEYHQGAAGFVVHVPSLHSPEMAPEGMHAMTIYTICPDRLKEGSFNELRSEFADRLVAYAEAHIPGLREHTVVRAILTPEDFRARTCADHHAFGGLAPVLGSARIPHQTPIHGLWFVGAQSESGGGVNNVIPSSFKVASKMIL